MKKISVTTVIFCASLLSACAPTISNFSSYQNKHIANSSFMPTKDNLKGALPKVLIIDFAENNNQVAIGANLGKALAVNVENALTKERLVQLVDRKVAKNLEEEIKLSQMSGKDVDYSGPAVADYAISGAISDASFSKKYSAGMTLYSKEAGFYKTPPKFSYNAQVSGNVKVYQIPSMNVVENFEFSGYAGRSENVQKSGGASFAGIIEIGADSAAAADRDDGLVRKAAENGIGNVSAALQNAFAKKGYVLERRTLKNKSIFKISLGSKDGINQGDKFDIIGQFEIENPITKETETESRILATGRVSDIINPESSFVILDKSDLNDSVRIGDVVKLKYQKSFAQKVINFSKYIPN